MKRHLKIQGRLRIENKEVEITILEQTHAGYTFSQKGKSNNAGHHSGCFHHNGVLLIGLTENSTYFEPNAYSGHYLCIGKARTCKIPLEYWQRLKEAVTAYNNCEWDPE